MKRWIALIVACMICLGAVGYAAEWAEGTSPAQPYPGKPEIDLSSSMGYFMLFPNARNAKLVAEHYCDTLMFYLPREDVELGKGALHLYQVPEEGGKAVEVGAYSFADAQCVKIRPLDEEELVGLMWGSGVCIEVRLSKSLELNASYYVLMDASCFSAAGNTVQSIPIANPEAWTPAATGDFGVSGLYYSAPVAQPEEGEEAEAVEPAPKAVPGVGDDIHFDLVLGGEATSAVIFYQTDCVSFGTLEYSESCAVTGTVTDANLSWGVVFLDANMNILETVNLK